MNKTTLEFISEHWHLLLKPESANFAALIQKSPLASVTEIMQELHEGPISLQELSDRVRMHPNSVASITRALEGKLFASVGVQQQRVISLLPVVQQDKPATVAEGSKSQQINKKGGRYLAVIPEQKHYHLIQSKSDRWFFGDNATIGVRVISPDPSPWGKQWTIVPARQNQKSDKALWYFRVDFRLYPPEEGVPTILEREQYKGYFAYAKQASIDYFNFYLEEKEILSYSFYEKLA